LVPFSIKPKIWSGWKCEISTVEIFAGSMPAPFRLSGRLTAVGCHCPTPEPESTMISLSPIFSTMTVSGIGT
jgi:hypothetical protein